MNSFKFTFKALQQQQQSIRKCELIFNKKMNFFSTKTLFFPPKNDNNTIFKSKSKDFNHNHQNHFSISLIRFKEIPNKSEVKSQPSFPPGNPIDKAKLEHLLFIKDNFAIHLKKIFKEVHPYAFYTPDVIFENFYFDEPKTVVGVGRYAWQLSLLRIKANLKFSLIKVDILQAVCDEAESSVTFRWRITGISGFKSMIQPWKIKAWKIKESVESEAEYYDGISTFYIRGDGRIVKHRVARVMTQKDEDEVKEKNLKKLRNLNVDTALFKLK